MRFVANKNNLQREEAESLLLSPKPKIAIDFETVSIDNLLVLGLGIAVSGSLGFYFFNPHDPMIAEVFDSAQTVIAHNSKFDIPKCRDLGLTIRNYEDTKMIAYSGGILDNSLEALSASILHRACPKVTDQWRRPNQGNIAIDHVRMGGICIIHACNTFELERILPKTQLYWDIDKPYLDLLMEMEGWGVLIDQYRLTKVEQATMNQVLPLERRLLDELGIENLASNPQVAEALRTKGIIGTRKTRSDKDSVGEESLKPLNLPLTNDILKWRSLMKTLTTYVPAFRGNTDRHGKLQGRLDIYGRLHTNFGFTRTGRNSSSRPNLQNITRDEKFEQFEEEEDESS